jgi:hypothetical protein
MREELRKNLQHNLVLAVFSQHLIDTLLNVLDELILVFSLSQ